MEKTKRSITAPNRTITLQNRYKPKFITSFTNTDNASTQDDRRQLRIRIMRALYIKDTDARNNNRHITFPMDDDLRGRFDMQYVSQEMPIFERSGLYTTL